MKFMSKKQQKMKPDYRTSNAFFVSSVGRRLQKQIKSALAEEDLQRQSAVLIGSIFPFLAVFEQNNPDIVLEKEQIVADDLVSPLLPVHSVNITFIAALNESVAENLPTLIKETSRFLKPHGRLFLLFKNKRKPCFLSINEMPDLSFSFLSKELEEAGFSLQKRKGLLHFPYASKMFGAADQFLFSHLTSGGHFTLFIAQKNPTVLSAAENYSSVRITKASVLTSPRT